MPPLRLPPRQILSTLSPQCLLPRQQRRWAEVHDIRFVATTRATYNVIDKYSSKLAAKAAAEGHESIGQLKEAYKEKIDAVKQHEGIAADIASMPDLAEGRIAMDGPPSPPPAPAVSSVSPSAASSQPGSTTGSNEMEGNIPSWTVPNVPSTRPSKLASPAPAQQSSKIKPLAQILDLNKVADLPVPELTAIWRLHYASNPQSLCAVIPATTFSSMEVLAKECPQFVLPVPREMTDEPAEAGEAGTTGQAEGDKKMGAEIHFLQWTWDIRSKTCTVLFTNLAEYKLRGEYAVPHTTITHYLDLRGSKGVVLMQGSVVEGRGVSMGDAKWLVMCLQRFYGGWAVEAGRKEEERTMQRARERRRLLEWFRAGDGRFSLEKLMEETERSG